MWRRLMWVIVILLTACTTTVQPPAPTQSPLMTPAPLTEQMYLPLMYHSYPRVERAVGGGLLGVMDTTYHHWTVSPTNCDPDFVRTVWCVTDYHLALYTPQIEYAATHCPGNSWTILNEPDDSGSKVVGGQCGAYKLTGNPFDVNNPSLTVYQNPEETARRVIGVYDLIHSYDPTARVFVGGLGWIGHDISRAWWSRFVAEIARNGRMDVLQFIHFHAYPNLSFEERGMQAFEEGVAEWVAFNRSLGLSVAEYWMTETGDLACYGWSAFDPAGWYDVRDSVMLPILDWMDRDAMNLGITKVFWFLSWWGGADGLPFWCGFLADARTSPAVLTPLGEAWR